ncbi:trigger factor [Coprobacillus sp. CAG:826]|jgi:trigger factor|nr:trigger factor [Coprobacillus sp. CAG:826]
MKRTVNRLENSQVELILSFEGEEWKDANKKAFDKLAKEVEVPGFRKGHAPENLVRQKIDHARVINDAIDMLLQPAYETALDEEKIMPFARPNLEITKVTDDEMEAKISIIVAPEVELGQYKGLHVEKTAVEVTPEEIDAEIAKLASDNAELITKTGEAALGDTVVIDFVGYVDGKAFDGGAANNYSLELGSNSFIPGFEDQIVGMKENEEKDIQVKFPENYVPELKGKDATFHIVLHEVKEKKVPAIDADFVSELAYDGVETVDQLKTKVENDIRARKEQDAKNAYYEALVKLIRDGSKITIHPQIIHDEVEAMKENFANQVQQNGLTLEQYYQITGQTPEDVESKMAVDAEINIRSVLALEKIAEVENLHVTQEEVDFELAKIAQQYSMELEKVKEILKPQMSSFARDIQNRKISEFLLANND